jgi:hypothetical protein
VITRYSNHLQNIDPHTILTIWFIPSYIKHCVFYIMTTLKYRPLYFLLDVFSVFLLYNGPDISYASGLLHVLICVFLHPALFRMWFCYASRCYVCVIHTCIHIECSLCRLIKRPEHLIGRHWYLPANWRSFIRWSPDQWVSQCYAIECYRSFYCALSCVFMTRVSQCPINLRSEHPVHSHTDTHPHTHSLTHSLSNINLAVACLEL